MIEYRYIPLVSCNWEFKEEILPSGLIITSRLSEHNSSVPRNVKYAQLHRRRYAVHIYN